MNLEKIQRLSNNEDKNLAELGLKLNEEAGEVSEAILSATGARGCEYKELTYKDVEEEAVDTILVALSIFFKVGGRIKDLEFLVGTKTDKWERVAQSEEPVSTERIIEAINSAQNIGMNDTKIDLTGIVRPSTHDAINNL